MIRVRIGSEEHELTWDEWERRVREGRVPPDALVQFEAVTGEAWETAESLELYRSLRNDAALAWQGAFTSGPPPILTALLVGVQVRVWWFARIDDVRGWLLSHFTNWTGPALENGEVWRPISMGFLHADLFHLVLNMLWLAYTGWNIERALGRRNLLTIYLGAVVGGAVLSMFGSPQTPSLGASGGVFGLVAASTVFGFVRPELLPRRGRRLFGAAMLPYLVLMFWSGLMNEDTDNWSHFGGLVVGAVLGFVLDPEPLQRRAGWNRRFQMGLVAIVLLITTTFLAVGPRILPLVDSEVARAQANPRHTGPLPDSSDRDLRWAVPAGWRPARDLSGMPGFASRAGDRSFGVRQRTLDRLTTTEEVASSWLDELQQDWPQLQASEPEPTVLGGRPAWTRRVKPDPRQEMVVVWTGTARGAYTLESTWVVEASREARLGPLYRRLMEQVRWTDPAELLEARADVAFASRSVDGRTALAEALGRVGETQASVALHRELVAEAPDDPHRWVSLFDTVALGGVDDEVRVELWSGALGASTAPRVIVAVADDLDAANRPSAARGLLEHAWQLRPGDRRLRRARRARGLPTSLSPTGQPWSSVYDPVTGEPRPEPLPVPDGSPSLGRAERAADTLEQRQADLVTAVCDAAATQDARAAWPPLLFLRDGRLPEVGSDTPRAVLDELSGPSPAEWVPSHVSTCLGEDLSEWLGQEAAPSVAPRG